MNHGKLILTSDGFKHVLPETIVQMFNKYSAGKSIAIIDNATLTGHNIRNQPEIKNNFMKVAKDIHSFTLTEKTINNIFEYDVLYITGGDVLPMIDMAKIKNIKNNFLKFIESGKTIICESAGSIVMAKDMKYYFDTSNKYFDKELDVNDFSGIGLTNINLFSHIDVQPKDVITRIELYEKSRHIKITGVANGDFIELDFDDLLK